MGMCGRYRLTRLDLEGLCFRVRPQDDDSQIKIVPRFNVAPSQFMPIIRPLKKKKGEDEYQLVLAKGDFVAFWTKGKPKLAPINAKSETIATSALFRGAFKDCRFLVHTDGFYEWKGAKPPKQPYFIHMKDDGLFAFAGLYSQRKPEDGEPVDTFTILTTEPNSLLKPIHSRMPVIRNSRHERITSRESGREFGYMKKAENLVRCWLITIRWNI